MARSTTPLNPSQIKNAQIEPKEYSLCDGDGLALRVKPNGTKLWLFNYPRPFIKTRTNISLGTYPEVTLLEARQKRLEARALLAKGIDPQEHRNQIQSALEEAHANTLERVAARWIEAKKNKIKLTTANDIWRSLELHIFPKLGKIPIHLITAPKTIDELKPLAARGNLETVKRVCQRINEVMVHALNVGLIKTNPLAGIYCEFNQPTATKMPTLTPAELPELMRAINQASIKHLTRCLIEWQLHTMTRPSEAAGARWCEIDTEAALWTIPAERMKRNRTHVIPLTPQTLAILDVLRPISGHREHLFTSQTDYSKPASSETVNTALKRNGFRGRLVAHGLRALASTTLNEQRFDAEIIEAALSHADKNQVRSAYNRSDYVEQRRVLMNWWSEHIERAANGNLSVAAVNNVVDIKTMGAK